MLAEGGPVDLGTGKPALGFVSSLTGSDLSNTEDLDPGS